MISRASISSCRPRVTLANMNMIVRQVSPVEALQPFLQQHSAHFWHELRCFAAAPFSATTYDRVVRYTSSAAEATAAAAPPLEGGAGSDATSQASAQQRAGAAATARARAALPTTPGATSEAVLDPLRTPHDPARQPQLQRPGVDISGSCGRGSRWDRPSCSAGRGLSCRGSRGQQTDGQEAGPDGRTAGDAILVSSDDEAAPLLAASDSSMPTPAAAPIAAPGLSRTEALPEAAAAPGLGSASLPQVEGAAISGSNQLHQLRWQALQARRSQGEAQAKLFRRHGHGSSIRRSRSPSSCRSRKSRRGRPRFESRRRTESCSPGRARGTPGLQRDGWRPSRSPQRNSTTVTPRYRSRVRQAQAHSGGSEPGNASDINLVDDRWQMV